MSQSVNQENQPSQPNHSLQPVSFEEAQAVLRRHGIRVDEGDVEVVMLAALHGAFHQRSRELLDRHSAALAGIMGKSVTELREILVCAQTDFASAVRSVALENVTALISQHQKDMAELDQNIRRASLLTAGGAAFSAACIFIGMGVLLWLK